MEHHYEIPKIEDIELYYDLVSALIGVLQGTINILNNFCSELAFVIIGPQDNVIGRFEIKYEYDKPEIHANWTLNEKGEKLMVDISERFFYFLNYSKTIVNIKRPLSYKGPLSGEYTIIGQERLERIQQGQKLPPLPFHGLRHTSITMLIAQGIPLPNVSRRAGHANTSTTANIYAHALKSIDRDAANILDQILSGNDKEKGQSKKQA